MENKIWCNLPDRDAVYNAMHCLSDEIMKDPEKHAAEVISKVKLGPGNEDIKTTTMVSYFNVELQYFIEECITDPTGPHFLFIHAPSLFTLRSDDSFASRVRAFAFLVFDRYKAGQEFIVLSHEDNLITIEVLDACIMMCKYDPAFEDLRKFCHYEEDEDL